MSQEIVTYGHCDTVATIFQALFYTFKMYYFIPLFSFYIPSSAVMFQMDQP